MPDSTGSCHGQKRYVSESMTFIHHDGSSTRSHPSRVDHRPAAPRRPGDGECRGAGQQSRTRDERRCEPERCDLGPKPGTGCLPDPPGSVRWSVREGNPGGTERWRAATWRATGRSRPTAWKWPAERTCLPCPGARRTHRPRAIGLHIGCVRVWRRRPIAERATVIPRAIRW